MEKNIMKNQAEFIKFLQDHNLGDADEASAIIDDAKMYIDSESIENYNDYMNCADHDTHMVLDEKSNEYHICSIDGYECDFALDY